MDAGDASILEFVVLRFGLVTAWKHTLAIADACDDEARGRSCRCIKFLMSKIISLRDETSPNCLLIEIIRGYKGGEHRNSARTETKSRESNHEA